MPLLFQTGSSAEVNSTVKSSKSPSYLLFLGASNIGSNVPIIGYEGGPGILFTRRTKRTLLTMRGSKATAAIANSATSTIVGSIACETHLYFYTYLTNFLLSPSAYSAPIIPAPNPQIAHCPQQFPSTSLIDILFQFGVYTH